MASISIQKDSSSSSFSSSSFSSSKPQWKYDVFLSFRGEDTRNSFTDHLYAALNQKGIVTFRDEEKLERGKSISPELLKAIEESRFAIVILSRNYASSTWCLNELAKIIECKREIGTTVWPVFYDVDPSNVRKQTESFAQAFATHEEHFKDHIKKVQTWRATLEEVANLKGWHLQDRPESIFIQNIVGELWHKLSYAFLEDTEGLVGIESQVKKLESYLAIEFNDIRFVGVWGMGGIGKTTLARVVSRMVAEKYEGYCFLANVREVCEKGGLVSLQQQLISQILNQRMNIQNVDDGVLKIKNQLRHKRILLVLDDVNELDQLKKLAEKHNWFGLGSRVIITTRDKHLLHVLGVDKIYEIKGLNDDEALHLLSLKAFKNNHPLKDYLELSKDVVQYTKGLPLAIEILGSFLFGKSIKEWKEALSRFTKFLDDKIHQALRISYDGLHVTEKEIFLYIACFFNHEDKDSVVEKLDYLGLYPNVGLGVLVDKSLIKMSDTEVWMHDLLEENGRRIVREKSPGDPGSHSNLWSFEDINNVLTKNEGTGAIQAIVLKLPKLKEANWNPESFSKLQHLKLLIIKNIQLVHELKHLPNGLRFLDWSRYPSKSLPLNFQSNDLFELYMCNSYIKRLWKGEKSFERLKIIQMNNSSNLIETPNFTKVPNLEKLVLEDCINLTQVHPSIGVHKKLTLLNLKGCKNLKTLPNKFEIESLKILILSGCSKVRKIPEFEENMQRVLELYLDETAITKLPTSIGHLTGLALLNIKYCKSLTCLPNTLFNLKFLKDVNISGCTKLGRLPENLGNAESIEKLDLSETTIRQVPSSISILKNLKVLSFYGCKGLSSSNNSWYEVLPFYFMPRSPNPVGLSSLSSLCSLTKLNFRGCNLKEIPIDIGSLFCLEEMDLSENSFVCLPESISQLRKLRIFRFANCTSLRSLPKFPSSIVSLKGYGCTSLETVPELLKPNSLCEAELILANCSRLANNQGVIDVFFAVIRKHLQGLSLDNRYDIQDFNWIYNILIPGSVIPKWFSHQSMGDEVTTTIPSSHLCDELIGIAICVVFCSCPHHQIDKESSLQCFLMVNGKNMSSSPLIYAYFTLSDHILLLYVLPQYFMDDEDNIALRKDCEANESNQFGIKIEADLGLEVKECGFRMVYKKDIEDLNQTMAQSSNLVVVAEGNKKQTCDDYEGVGPSGDRSSNDVPHLKGIERLTKLNFHGNSDCGESIESMEQMMSLLTSLVTSDCGESIESAELMMSLLTSLVTSDELEF